MSAPAIQHGYPLAWPDIRRRTPRGDRKAALFRHEGRTLTLSIALHRLREQVAMMTRPGRDWRVTDQLLSTNIRFTLSGARDRNVSRSEPDDTGVAFYFALDGRPHVLSCDRWDTVADNVAAIAAHIEALRGQERWGVANLRQAFAGHVALPDPGAHSPGPQGWRDVLGLGPAATLADARQKYRHLAREAHPDAGGDRAAWDRLQRAIEQAEKELGR